jgi:hypothetical protein
MERHSCGVFRQIILWWSKQRWWEGCSVKEERENSEIEALIQKKILKGEATWEIYLWYGNNIRMAPRVRMLDSGDWMDVT